MIMSTEQTVLVEFADVLEDYLSRERELLDLLRRFRSSYLETVPVTSAATSPGTRRPPPPSMFRPPPERHRRRPPPPVRLHPAPVGPTPTPGPDPTPISELTPAPPPSAAARKERGATPWPDELLGGPVHATKRDYDYFADLDQRLGLRAPTVDGAA